MHNELIQDLAIILLLGGIFGFCFKKFLKLPMVLGYIFAGVIIRAPLPYTPFILKPDLAKTLAEVGVLLLMFSMGLHFNVRKIQSLGIRPIAISVTQALLMLVSGKAVATALGFNSGEAVFIGAAMMAASTAIIIKVLDDFKLKTSHFAEKLMGILMIEDSVSIFIIIWLTASFSAQQGNKSFSQLFPLFIGSVLSCWLLGTIILPRLIRLAFKTGKEELLVIISLGFVLGLAHFSSSVGFSSALGAFIIGAILSECREMRKIETLIEPVVNIFALIFFVSVGLLFSHDILFEQYKVILILAATLIACKILYNFFLNLIAGQGLKDSLKMSGSMGQIGEISFVIAQLGQGLGVIDGKIFSIIVAVAIITMLFTPPILKIFISLSERTDTLVPVKLQTGLNAYSEFIYAFSLSDRMAPVYGKSSLLSWFRSLFDDLKNKLQSSYIRATSKNVTATFTRLAPWDEYLVPVHVGGNTLVTGKNLIELRLRENYNINVVAIERDGMAIISPKPTEMIVAGDTLIVYGNEQCISKLEATCLIPTSTDEPPTIDECTLVLIKLQASHPFVGKSIIHLGIRIVYNCIVLAVNRNTERIKNPVSSFVFEEKDEIFIFGTRQAIAKIKELY